MANNTVDRQNYGYILQAGVTPQTRTAISQKSKVFSFTTGDENSNMFQIGVLGGFNPTESRDIQVVRGIGYGDQVAEQVPSVTEPMSIAVNRTMLYLHNIYQAFGYNSGVAGVLRSLKHHRWPFDVKHELVISEISGMELQSVDQFTGHPSNDPEGSLYALITYYEACWMSDYGVEYPADSAIVAENTTIKCTDIYADGKTYQDLVQDTSNRLKSRTFGSFQLH